MNGRLCMLEKAPTTGFLETGTEHFNVNQQKQLSEDEACSVYNAICDGVPPPPSCLKATTEHTIQSKKKNKNPIQEANDLSFVQLSSATQMKQHHLMMGRINVVPKTGKKSK